MEYICTNLSCKCQRVLIKVLHLKSASDHRPREVATISYTWSRGSDETWRKINAETSNPFLDPLHRQASYAKQLLAFWSDIVETQIQFIGSELFKLVAADDRQEIILHFSIVESMASATPGILTLRKRKMNSDQRNLRLCNVRPEIYQILVITERHRVFSSHDELDKALDGF